MEETWKDLYFIQDGIEFDYRGLYQVSNYGNVKSLKDNKRKEREKILKPKNKKGYLQINLYKNGKQKTFQIHRLVAHMFCEGYFDGYEVNHIDENKENNRADNLEWCTHKYNINYGTGIERSAKAQRGKNNPRARKVAQYNLNGNLIKIWDCMMDVKRALGISTGNIYDCCHGKLKQTGGYIWRYYEED